MWVRAPLLSNYPNAFTTGPLGGGACGNAAIRLELHADGYFAANTGADNASCSVNFGGPVFTSAFSANVWHSITVTWDSGQAMESTYLDGQLSQVITNGFWPSAFDAVKIGVG